MCITLLHTVRVGSLELVLLIKFLSKEKSNYTGIVLEHPYVSILPALSPLPF